MYLDIYKFYVPALKPTPSTSNTFVKYSSKTFWEEWMVGKFNMQKQHDASGNEHSLSSGKKLTLIDRDILHGGLKTSYKSKKSLDCIRLRIYGKNVKKYTTLHFLEISFIFPVIVD